MKDPIRVTVSDGGEQLQHEGLDLGLEERRRHEGQQCFEVVLNEVHHDEHPLADDHKSKREKRDCIAHGG